MIPTIETLELLRALPLAKEGEVFFVVAENCAYRYNSQEWVVEEEPAHSDIALGSLYDLNKQVILNLPDLIPEEIMKGLDLINDFVKETNATYYMLLNHDVHYYTVFLRNGQDDPLPQALLDCLEVFGGPYKCIDYTVEGDAIEIWLDTELHGSLMFLLFPYDGGIVPCQ